MKTTRPGVRPRHGRLSGKWTTTSDVSRFQVARKAVEAKRANKVKVTLPVIRTLEQPDAE